MIFITGYAPLTEITPIVPAKRPAPQESYASQSVPYVPTQSQKPPKRNKFFTSRAKKEQQFQDQPAKPIQREPMVEPVKPEPEQGQDVLKVTF